MIMAGGGGDESDRPRPSPLVIEGAAVAKETGRQAQVANHNTESVDPDGGGERRRREGRVMVRNNGDNDLSLSSGTLKY